MQQSFHIPLVPDGADYYSILENIYLLTPLSRNRKLFRSGGGIKSLRAFVCGWGAKPIADMLQSKVLSAAQLVDRHSALPFYERFVPPGLAPQWRKAVLTHSREGLYTAKNRWEILNSSRLRACLSCIEDDLHQFGTSYWRELHHLPGARVCSRHGEELVEQPESVKRTDVLDKGLLPDMVVDIGLIQKMVRKSFKAHKALADLVECTVGGGSTSLGPRERSLKLLRVVDLKPENLKSELMSFWGTETLRELSLNLEVAVNDQAIERLTRGTDYGCHPVLLAALITMIESGATCLPIPDGSDEDFLSFLAARFELPIEMVNLAVEVGYPLAAASALYAGDRRYVVAGDGLATERDTDCFFSVLPMDLWQGLPDSKRH